MPEDLHHDFGSVVRAMLLRHNFAETHRQEDPPLVAIDYVNNDIAMRLIFDYHGEALSLSRLGLSECRYELQGIFEYLRDGDVGSRLEDAMPQFERAYARIARLFRVGNSEWASFARWIDDRDRKKFH